MRLPDACRLCGLCCFPALFVVAYAHPPASCKAKRTLYWRRNLRRTVLLESQLKASISASLLLQIGRPKARKDWPLQASEPCDPALEPKPPAKNQASSQLLLQSMTRRLSLERTFFFFLCLQRLVHRSNHIPIELRQMLVTANAYSE